MLTLAWLIDFVHHNNIRGYVPTQFAGLSLLGISCLALLFILAIIAQRRPVSIRIIRESTSYFIATQWTDLALFKYFTNHS